VKIKVAITSENGKKRVILRNKKKLKNLKQIKKIRTFRSENEKMEKKQEVE
jgi:hypothetical protein